MMHLFPTLTYRRLGNVILTRKGNDRSKLSLSYYLQPLSVSVFRAVMIVTATVKSFGGVASLFSRSSSPFVYHIPVIIRGVAKKETTRIYAQRNIAVVAYVTRWLLSRCHKVREPMGFIGMVVNTKLPITPVASRAYPSPASAFRPLAGSPINVRPKALNVLLAQRWNSTITKRHRSEVSFQVESGSVGSDKPRRLASL